MDLKIPILWIDLKPIVRLEMSAFFQSGDSIPKDPREWVISADRGRTRLKLFETFERVWNERKVTQEIGGPHVIAPTQTGLEILAGRSNGESVWLPVDVLRFAYTVMRRVWLGSFTPEDSRGVFNYKDGRFTPSYLPIGVIPRQRDETWVEVGDPGKLAVSTLGLLVTTEGWQVTPGTGEISGIDMVFVKAEESPETRS